ncbi:MAG TPA: patatin-like phospholipase family protein, partial [Humisphaera sp.]|nr:patatin-like phospholipase family protein [Humisphaera sp.]
LAEVPGLERELRTDVSDELIQQIAARGADGRVLAVNTTDVDNGGPRVFDLVDEAARAKKTGEYERFRQIMLASAGIPGVFPARIIDDVMYVDGGSTGNIIFGGRLDEQDTFPAMWKKAYPDLKMPTVRYWVIFNNQLRPQPQVTKASWVAVVQRSMETGTRAATTTAMRQLLAMAEIARLKQNADVQVRIVSIPEDWVPPNQASFDKQTMNSLVDLGERMGADPASWKTELPD